MISRNLYFLICILLTVSCNKEKSGQHNPKPQKYSIYVMMKDGSEYMVQTDSLHAGQVHPSESGVAINPSRIYYELIVSNGYYYWVDMKTKAFVKYKILDGQFTKDSELSLNGISIVENYNWVGDDTLLVMGYDDSNRKVRYAKISVNNMQAVQGEINLPAPFGVYTSMSVGFSKLLKDTLLVGYTYHATKDLNHYTTGDTIYVETLSYPEMKSLGRSKDTRSAFPGGPNTRQSHFFTDEKSDFYFIACPGIASGNNPTKPTGILRIKKSETVIDTGYFFDISNSVIQNHGYGFWYTGNGKAIVRTERKGIFTGMKDHWKVPHFDFYVLDLAAQTTSRLSLPLDKGTARQCVLVEDGVVYITINADREGSNVWVYDPRSGSLQKGLGFDKEVDFVLRLERLY